MENIFLTNPLGLKISIIHLIKHILNTIMKRKKIITSELKSIKIL